jgi:hypothetical protein
MSLLNKNRTQENIALAFLKSNGHCVYCNTAYAVNTDFEFEHPIQSLANDDSKALIACARCNRNKAKKSVLNVFRGDAEKTAKVLNLLDLQFSKSDVLDTIKMLAETAIKSAISENRALTGSELRFICTPNARLTELPKGLKIDGTPNELAKVNRIYDLRECDVYTVVD